mmetsp:Transcript_8584/g.16933  ORF Transcript_8584/g.16933 Transcript_8584/m.16933 type:complete len:87 (+) Transcript_8584:1095-1355(+)
MLKLNCYCCYCQWNAKMSAASSLRDDISVSHSCRVLAFLCLFQKSKTNASFCLERKQHTKGEGAIATNCCMKTASLGSFCRLDGDD